MPHCLASTAGFTLADPQLSPVVGRAMVLESGGAVVACAIITPSLAQITRVAAFPGYTGGAPRAHRTARAAAEGARAPRALAGSDAPCVCRPTPPPPRPPAPPR